MFLSLPSFTFHESFKEYLRPLYSCFKQYSSVSYIAFCNASLGCVTGLLLINWIYVVHGYQRREEKANGVIDAHASTRPAMRICARSSLNIAVPFLIRYAPISGRNSFGVAKQWVLAVGVLRYSQAHPFLQSTNMSSGDESLASRKAHA